MPIKTSNNEEGQKVPELPERITVGPTKEFEGSYRYRRDMLQTIAASTLAVEVIEVCMAMQVSLLPRL